MRSGSVLAMPRRRMAWLTSTAMHLSTGALSLMLQIECKNPDSCANGYLLQASKAIASFPFFSTLELLSLFLNIHPTLDPNMYFAILGLLASAVNSCVAGYMFCVFAKAAWRYIEQAIREDHRQSIFIGTIACAWIFWIAIFAYGLKRLDHSLLLIALSTAAAYGLDRIHQLISGLMKRLHSLWKFH